MPRDPVATAERNAAGKAAEVVRRGAAARNDLVLAVDTIVVVDDEILGKAADEPQARAFLRLLAGRTHDVVSGLCLRRAGEERLGHCVTAVTFRTLADSDVERYVATGEWRERAGAYAIQGFGSSLVAGVRGDYFNVVGLPVALLADALASLRAAVVRVARGAPVKVAGAFTGDRRGGPVPATCRILVTSRPRPKGVDHRLPGLHDGLRRPRHGRRSRYRQHPRLRPRPRHRALRAVGGRHRPSHRRGARRRRRGQAHARPHAGQHQCRAAAQRRRHRRLRRHRADAASLHPQGLPEPLGAPARGHLRALRASPASRSAPSKRPPTRPAPAGPPSSKSRWRPPSAPACRSPSPPAA